MIKEINVRSSVHGVYGHNDVVPGVEKVVLALNGDEHSPDSAVDFQGNFAVNNAIILNGDVGTYGMAAGDEVLLKCEREKSKMTYSVNQERGFATHVVTLELYVPHLTRDTYHKLNNGLRTGYVGLVFMNDKFEVSPPMETDDNTADETAPTTTASTQGMYIVGVDNVLGTTGDAATGTGMNYLYSDFALFIDSIEYDSGAALTDKNGATLRLTSVQGTEPKHESYA